MPWIGLMLSPLRFPGPTFWAEAERKVHFDVDWRAPARLCRRRGFMAEDAVEIGRGDLAEVVALAINHPEAEQMALFVSYETCDRKLPWSQIRELAMRVDFPLFI